MKRIFGMSLSALLLSACGGGRVSVELSSADADGAGQALTAAQSLVGVEKVEVTVSQVLVHVAGEGEDDESIEGVNPDDGDGDGVPGLGETDEDVDSDTDSDGRGGWIVVSDEEQVVDLMTLRADATERLGETSIPDGKVTQLRLALKAEDTGGGKGRIAGAVTDADGTRCDLLVPHSAFKPGLKVKGLHKLLPEENGAQRVVVSLQLRDSTRVAGEGGCAFSLNPVLRVMNGR